MAAPEIRYQSEPIDQRLIEPLDQITLIYQRRSCITHMVAEPVPQMLETMGDAIWTATSLLSHLAADFELESRDEAVQAISARLEELADLGLVERLTDA
jgi:PqqD family protein of HPr-rel-A system